MSLLLATRHLQLSLRHRKLFSVTLHTSSEISHFINHISALEKDQKWTDISKSLDVAENKDDIIKKTFAMCAENIETSQSQRLSNNLWHAGVSKLPPCTFHTLIDASVAAKNIDQLAALLSEANSDSRVASAVGIGGIFGFYKPFLGADSSVVGALEKPSTFTSEVESKILDQFFQWVPLMDNESTLLQSELLFSKIHSLYCDDWDRMLSFIGHVTNSSASGALDLISSIDEAKASAFTLTAYDFIAAHDIDKATAFLENAIQRGHFSSASVTPGQYSNLVWKSIPLGWSSSPSSRNYDYNSRNKLKHKHNFSQESVEVDMSLAAYLNETHASSPTTTTERGSVPTSPQLDDSKGAELACIKNHLDNLFNLVLGSTDHDKKLRYAFYKNLLNSNRPRTLLSYESRRRAQEMLYYSSSGEHGRALPLDMEGYKCVIKAHANQLNARGIFRTLEEWNQTARLISTASANLNSDVSFVTPDSSVYKTIIAIFHVHPHMVSHKNLERLFEQMQLDCVTPDNNKDIISLFKFANKAKSVSMMNTLLAWVDAMMAADRVSSEDVSSPDSDQQPSFDLNNDIIFKTSTSNRKFTKADMIKIYDVALETNALEVDNGDKCLEILFAMKSKEIQLNGNRVAQVMKALKNSKNFDAVLELFHSMVALEVKRDTYHVSLAVVAYLRTGQITKGLALLDRFESAGQDLKVFSYFAAAFEILRRLCEKPRFQPFLVNDASGAQVEMQQKEAMIKCVDLFLHALKGENMFPGSKGHLQVSIKLLDASVYQDMVEYMEHKLSAAESEGSDASAVLPPAAGRLLQLFKELKAKNMQERKRNYD